ncbi:MAG TPA: hypothetical protein ENH80_09260, partial [Phycisphaerae bacterium]|nr:hypothetical protein [Phycisphaerae bacterium]
MCKLSHADVVISFAAIVVLAALAAPSMAGAADKVFKVDAFGAKPDKRADSAPAFRAAIAAAMKAGGGTVQFGPGKYYMMSSGDKIYVAWPKGAVGVHITGVKGRTELIVTTPRLGLLRFDRSKDCSLSNVICDYETPPFAQGKIVALDSKAGTFDLKIDEGFPELDAPFFLQGGEWGMPIDRNERHPKYVGLDHVWARSWSKVGDRTWRVVCRNRHNTRSLAVGDRYVQLARQKNPTIFGLWNCTNIAMTDIVVHASPGITNGVVMCDAIVFRRFQVRFRKGTSRLITSNGDGIHVHGNRRGPVIEDCYFEGICDDGVNLNSHMSPVVKVESDTRIVVDRGPVIFKVGDRIQISEPDTAKLRGTATIKAIRPEPGNRFALTLIQPIKGIKPNRPPPADARRPGRRRRGPRRRGGDVVYNLNSANAGFVIRGNTFRLHRRHGLLIRSGGGLIEKNLFDNICGVGILVMNGGALEGPIASNVVIRNNRLIGVGQSRHYGGTGRFGAIMVRTNGTGFKLAPERSISNISILDNEIIDPPKNALYLSLIHI